MSANFPIVITCEQSSFLKAYRLVSVENTLIEYIIAKAINYVGAHNVYLATTKETPMIYFKILQRNIV